MNQQYFQGRSGSSNRLPFWPTQQGQALRGSSSAFTLQTHNELIAKEIWPHLGFSQRKINTIVQQYPENFEDPGCLGPPVHFEVKADVSSVQILTHWVPCNQTHHRKEALDRYTAAGIIKNVEEPTSLCSNQRRQESALTQAKQSIKVFSDHCIKCRHCLNNSTNFSMPNASH